MKITRSIRIEAALWKELKKKAAEEETTTSALIEKIVMDHLQKSPLPEQTTPDNEKENGGFVKCPNCGRWVRKSQLNEHLAKCYK